MNIPKKVHRIVEENPSLTPEGIADIIHSELLEDGVTSISFQRCVEFTITVKGKTEKVLVNILA